MDSRTSLIYLLITRLVERCLLQVSRSILLVQLNNNMAIDQPLRFNTPYRARQQFTINSSSNRPNNNHSSSNNSNSSRSNLKQLCQWPQQVLLFLNSRAIRDRGGRGQVPFESSIRTRTVTS